jgi:uncharacterized NAD(P)/FAD-binding protein YdhS
MADPAEIVLAIIGAGPRGAGVLERIAANADLLDEDARLTIHLVDPHPPGAGRIWRHDQSALLKLNSMAEDVTMFTDESSVLAGPVLPGPSLIEWAAAVREGEITDVDLAEPHLLAQIEQLTGASFPTRQLQSLYLDWFYRRAVASLPERITVHVHATTAVAVDDLLGGRQRVRVATGDPIEADLVLYSLGHTGADPEPEHRQLAQFAERHDLLYLPPSFTADSDTSAIPPGETVLVRGMGLASVDLIVLLTEGRGGRFAPGVDGRLVYHPSGREPKLFLGSRRGVPYHSKISSTLAAPRVRPRFFTAEIAATLEGSRGRLSFRDDFWPLIAKEVLWGYYWELFTGHPERVSTDWNDFAERFAPLGWDSGKLGALIDETVLDPLDRLRLGEFDRPLEDARFASVAELQERVRDYIRTDLRLRSAPAHSATLGLFYSLLFSMFDLGQVIDSPKWSARSRLEDLPLWWHNLFSFIASGPPAHRLDELLALSEAGVVEFLGPQLRVRADERGRFVADSPSLPREVAARVLVDARLPRTRIGASDNPALRSLVESGVGSEEYLEDAESSGSTGLLEVRREDARVIDSLGQPHPRRFAIGAYTNAPFVGAFSRPRTNAVSFRENDRVARALLELAHELPSASDVSALRADR